MERCGHPRFYELLDELAELHSRKNSDYATEEEPLSNLKRCEKLGIPAWMGVIVRLEDKWDRIEKIAKKGKPAVSEESIIDTLKDSAVYALLCIVLIENKNQKDKQPDGVVYPCFCARCHHPWLGKMIKEPCPKCNKEDMVCTCEREDEMQQV